MKILALDLGTTTGWAIGEYSAVEPHTKKHIKSGAKSFQPSRYQSHGQRYLSFLLHIEALHKEFAFTSCVYEEVRKHIGTDAAHIYGGFVATLQTWCLQNAIEYRGIPVGTIKKHITGKGNAGKEDVIMAVKQKLNIFPKDDNEADAIALCDLVIFG